MSKMIPLVIPLFFLITFPRVALEIKLKACPELGKCSPTEIHLQPIAFVFKTI